MTVSQKQTIYGTIAQWAMLTGLASYVLFFVAINAAGPYSIWCFLFPLLFALYFLSFPVVIILSIIHRVQVRRLPGFFTGYMCMFLLFLLMLAALPNLVVSIKTERQREAVNNLKQIYEQQEQYKAKNGKYAHTFNELGWEPAGEIKYKYFLSPHESMKGSGGSFDYALPAGVKPNVADDSFTIVAIGDIDCDAYMDVWRIDSQKQLINDMGDKNNSAELHNYFEDPPRRDND